MGTQPRSDNPAASRQQPLSNGSTPCRLCVSSWVGTFVTLFSGVFNRLRQRPRSPALRPSLETQESADHRCYACDSSTSPATDYECCHDISTATASSTTTINASSSTSSAASVFNH